MHNACLVSYVLINYLMRLKWGECHDLTTATDSLLVECMYRCHLATTAPPLINILQRLWLQIQMRKMAAIVYGIFCLLNIGRKWRRIIHLHLQSMVRTKAVSIVFI